MANIFREAMKGKPINNDNQSPLNGIIKQFSDASYYGSKEDKAAGNSSMSNLGGDISNAMPGGNIDPRQFAKTFNPQDTEDVRKMQGMLGVKTDGVLGPKTLGALQNLQKGVSPQEAPEQADFSKSLNSGLATPEELDAGGLDYANTGSSEELDYETDYSGENNEFTPEVKGPKMPGVKGWLQRAMPGGQSGYGDPNAPNSSQEISDFNYQGGKESTEPRLFRQPTEFAGDDGYSEELEYGTSSEEDNPNGYSEEPDTRVSEFDPEGSSEEPEYGVSEELEHGVSDEYDDPYGVSEEEDEDEYEDEYGVSEQGGINPNPNQFGRRQGFQMPASRSQNIMDQYNRSKRFTNKY